MEIRIVPYAENYRDTVITLLLMLQQTLVDIDPEHVQILSESYKSNYLDYVIALTKRSNGTMLVAIQNDSVVGFAAGYIEEKDEEDHLSNRCPKRGRVSDLIVEDAVRHCNIGTMLLRKMENIFKEQGCEFIAIDVFAPNLGALDFYYGNGYQNRNIEIYKKLL